MILFESRKLFAKLHSFSPCNPHVKSKLFDSFCLSLYGSALWFSSSPELRSLEVTFNNILRRIWSLPRTCHTGILHCTAQLNSLYNIVVRRSSKLLSAALKSQSSLVHDVFVQSSTLTYTSLGSFMAPVTRRSTQIKTFFVQTLSEMSDLHQTRTHI